MSLFPQTNVKHFRRKKPREDEPRQWWPITEGSVLLAIDASISATGYALVHNVRPNPVRITSGVIVPVGTDEENRYDNLARAIVAKCRAFKDLSDRLWTPTDAVIEIPAGGQWGFRSATQLMRFARALGVCEAALCLSGLPPSRVRVDEWKPRGGRGANSLGRKSYTKTLVRNYFNHEPKDDNEADALAIALFICGQRNFK